MQLPMSPMKPLILPTQRLHGEAAYHMYPTFSPDGQLLACASELWSEVLFCVWDINTGQRTTLTSGPGPTAVAFSAGSERVALVREKEIDVFAWPSGQWITQVPLDRKEWEPPGPSIGFAGVDQLWVLCPYQEIWLWDLSSGQQMLHRQFRAGEWACTLTVLDGRLVIYTRFRDPEEKSTSSPRLRVELLETGEVILRTSPGTNPRFTSDLRHVMIDTDSGDRGCEVWDLVRGKLCGRVPASFGISSGRWPLSPEGRYLAWSSPEENCIKVWDTSQERLVQEIPTIGRYIPQRFSPSHWLLVAIANRRDERVDRTMILDPLTGVCLGETVGHPMAFEPELSSFSPCGRWFASSMSLESYEHWYDPVPAGTVLLTDLERILPFATPIVRAGA